MNKRDRSERKCDNNYGHKQAKSQYKNEEHGAIAMRSHIATRLAAVVAPYHVARRCDLQPRLLSVRRGKQLWSALVSAPTSRLARTIRTRLGDVIRSAFVHSCVNRRYKVAFVRAFARRVLGWVGPVEGGGCPHACEPSTSTRPTQRTSWRACTSTTIGQCTSHARGGRRLCPARHAARTGSVWDVWGGY